MKKTKQISILLCSYLSAMATAVFFSLSLLDWGALTCATTGLRSLFINSSTLSGFCIEANEQGDGERLPSDTLSWNRVYVCRDNGGRREGRGLSPLPARTVGPPPQTSLCSRPREPLYWWWLSCHRQTYLWLPAGGEKRRGDHSESRSEGGGGALQTSERFDLRQLQICS